MRSLSLTLLLLLIGPGLLAADGRLSGVRDEVRDPPKRDPPRRDPPPDTPRRPDRTDGGYHHHHDDGDDDGLFATMFIYGVTSPYWGPNRALADDFEPGWGEPVTHQPPRTAEQVVSADLLAAWQHDRDGVIHRWLRGEVSTAWRVGVQVALDRLDERDAHDHLLLGQADLSIRFAQGHGWAFTSGIGGRWLHDQYGTDGGIDVFYGIELWPITPLVLRGQIAGGRIGEAGVFEAWAHAGLGWRYGEAFVGERYMRIGAVTVSGPLLGAGVHW